MRLAGARTVPGGRAMPGRVVGPLLSPSLPQPLPLPFPPHSFAQRRSLREFGGGGDQEDPLVADAVSVLKNHRSRSRWSFLRSLCASAGGFTPDQISRVSLHLRGDPRLALRFFRWSNSSSLCHHDLSSYAAITHVLARARLRSDAQSLIRSAILHASGGCNGRDDAPTDVLAALAKTYRAFDSTPLVFDLLVRACLQARRVDRAVEIIRRLRRKGFSPAVSTCNELIRAVSKGGGAQAGFHLYEELFVYSDGGTGAPPTAPISPNVKTFNALLLASYRERRSADGIRREMEKVACRPNSITYSILMADLCEAGSVQEARALWEEMEKKGIKPDVTAYNTLIGGFSGLGEMEKAEELFREMVMGGMEPTAASYERLIGGYCCTGDVNNAVLLLDEMRRKHFTADRSTVEGLIRELCKEGRVVEALSMLRGEMGSGGFAPSREMFIYLIRGFCRDGQVDEALQIQKEMVMKGFEPDSEVYNIFVNLYLEIGDLCQAARLKDEMLRMGLLKGSEKADDEAI